MNRYTVTLTFTGEQADNPKEAAQNFAEWLNKDGNVLVCTYDVTNEETGEVTVVDLEER